MSAQFHGLIRAGKVVLDQQRSFDRFHASMKEGQRVTLDSGFFKKKRSNAQNSFLWCDGGPYATLAPELTKMSHELHKQGIIPAPVFFDVKAVHKLMGDKFLKQGTNDLYVIRSTTELTTVEFSAYIEQIAHWAAGLGIYVAMPNEEEMLSLVKGEQ